MTDVGKSLFCRVTATNASGSANADSNTVGPVTAAGGPQVATWNPARMAPIYVLSNGNKTATSTSPGWVTVLGTTSRNSGKRYLEFKMIIVSSADETHVMMGVGVDEGQNMEAIVGGSFYMGVTGGGTSWVVGSSNDPSPWTVVVNDIVQMAIDFDTRKAWVGLNNTWSGTPGTSGEWMSSATAAAWTAGMALFPWMDTIVEEFSIELKTAASSQTYAPPTGFSRWE